MPDIFKSSLHHSKVWDQEDFFSLTKKVSCLPKELFLSLIYFKMSFIPVMAKQNF